MIDDDIEIRKMFEKMMNLMGASFDGLPENFGEPEVKGDLTENNEVNSKESGKSEESKQDLVGDMEEKLEELPSPDDVFEIPTKDRPHDHAKSYSISYSFGSGMDKPDIKIGGDIPPEIKKELIKRIEKSHKLSQSRKPTSLLSGVTPRGLKGGHSSKKAKQQKRKIEREPVIDVIQEEDYVYIVMEMPGKEKEDIEISATLAEVSVNEFDIDLPVKVNVDKATSRLNNGILTIKLKTMADDNRKTRVEID